MISSYSKYINIGYTYLSYISIALLIMQGKVRGIRDRARPKKYWMVNITQWTDKTINELLKKVKDRDV